MTHSELQSQIDNANTASTNGNFDEAEMLANEVLAELNTATDSAVGSLSYVEKLRVNTLLSLAITAFRRGRYDTALERAQQALAFAEEYSLDDIKPKCWNIFGNVYQNLSDYSRALEYYAKALAAHEELGNKAGAAIVTGNIGNVYRNLSDSPRALEYYGKALATHEELGNKAAAAIVTGNIGNVYQNLSDYPRALKYFAKALAAQEELGQKAEAANVMGNIGLVYLYLSDYPHALEYMVKALSAQEELGDKAGAARVTGNIGIVYQNLSDYPRALEYYAKALAAHEELWQKTEAAIVTGNIGIVYHHLSDYPRALEYYGKSLAAHEELWQKAEAAIVTGNIGIVYAELSDYPRALEYYGKALAALEELGQKAEAAFVTGNIGVLYGKTEFAGYDPIRAEEYLLKAIALSEELGTKHHLYTVHKFLADLYKIEKRWEECQMHFEKYHEIEKEVQSEEAKKQAEKQDSNRKLAIERARAQATDEILANILPPNITERLIKGEKKIADAHESVSVLFVDIVGFTKMSTALPAGELIDLLDIVFTRFDVICKKYGLEKIKTIGDAYMAVCGAPVAYANHAERAALAALEMLEDFSIDGNFSAPINLGFRIGLHTGSVVAGIIGENKYSYDLWGDAVNTASRMESYGEEDKIHVSEEFLKRLLMVNGEWLIDVADEFSSLTINHYPLTINHLPLTIIPRGEIEIKGKGLLKTYFLEKAIL